MPELMATSAEATATSAFSLSNGDIGDAALVALAPALRRRPALERLYLYGHPFGDEGLAALVAPPPAAGTPPLPTGGLRKLKTLDLNYTWVSDAARVCYPRRHA